MNAYRYNPESKVYEGEQERQLDPLTSTITGEDVFLMPANCTDIPMALEPKEGYDIVFSGTDWEYKEQEQKSTDEKENTPYELTLEQKIYQLDMQFQADKNTLQSYYMSYMIADDSEGMESIKKELASLNKQYDIDLKNLKGAGN